MSDRIKRRRKQPEVEAKPPQKGSTSSFLYKVYEILEEPSFSRIVSWNENGTAFVVKKVTEFTDRVLPKYFKHKNFSSFVRQLNMYDFHKIKGNEYSNCFSHALFQRGAKHLIKDIKRKIGAAEGESIKPEPNKKAKTKDMLSTINELSQRLVQLEERGKDYEELLRDYRDISERNQRLEQMVMCFSQMVAKNNGGRYNEPPSPNPIDGAPRLSPRIFTNSASNTPIHGLIGDLSYPLGRIPGNKFPTMSKNIVRPNERQMMIQAPDKSPAEECKDPDPVNLMYAKKLGLDIDEMYFRQSGISPKLSELRAVPNIFSPGISPGGALASPFNQAVDTPVEREPNYLKNIELSPLRSWTKAAVPDVDKKLGDIMPISGEDQIGDKSTACNEVLAKTPVEHLGPTEVVDDNVGTRK